MKYNDTPATLHPLTAMLDDVCETPYIYHFEEIPLPCFFLQVNESHTYITEYIADKLIIGEVMVPQSTCTSTVFTLEDTRDTTLSRLVYNIDQLAFANEPQGICIGIRIKPAVTANAKDENLSRFFSILAEYKKVCWVFYTRDMNLCDSRGITRLITDNFGADLFTLRLGEYLPDQLAQIVINKLEELNITFLDREEALMELEDMLSDCKGVNQALGCIPALLKSTIYYDGSMVLTAEDIRTTMEDKQI